MTCRLCENWASKPCTSFLGPHRFCHTCGMTRLVHDMAAKRRDAAPVLIVIEGGKGDGDDD